MIFKYHWDLILNDHLEQHIRDFDVWKYIKNDYQNFDTSQESWHSIECLFPKLSHLVRVKDVWETRDVLHVRVKPRLPPPWKNKVNWQQIWVGTSQDQKDIHSGPIKSQ